MGQSSDEQNATKTDKTDDGSLDFLAAYIAARVLEQPSITDQELADELKVSRQTVNRKRNSKEVRASIAQTYQIPDTMIRQMMLKSILKLDALLDSPDPKIQLAVAALFMKLGQGLITKVDPSIPEVDPYSDAAIQRDAKKLVKEENDF